MSVNAATSLADSSVAVIGTGKSGLASANVLSTLGSKVTLLDSKESALEKADGKFAKKILPDNEQGARILDEIDPDLVVVSPGIPPAHIAFKWTEAKGVQLWGEVELAWRIQRYHSDRPNTPWVCVTGTNGKTTTVGMTESILRASGKNVKAVGNVGEPVVTVAAEGNLDVLAVELSSFQLHTVRSLSPLAAVCLNVANDHLDWHGSQAAYVADKARIYERTQKFCIYNREEPITLKMVEDADVIEGARAIGIGMDIPGLSDLGIVEDMLIDRAFLPTRERQKHGSILATFADLEHLSGGHPSVPLVTDALAAAALARSAGAELEHVAAGLRDYHPAAHRRAVVGKKADLVWIDDSKATNAHAALASLSGMPKRSVIWIAGGDAKGQDFNDLVKAVEPVLRAVILIGNDREPLRSALSNQAPHVPVHELEYHDDMMTSVIHEAIAHSVPGNFVVLAPACASWDQFANYGQRGDLFAQAVADLEVL